MFSLFHYYTNVLSTYYLNFYIEFSLKIQDTKNMNYFFSLHYFSFIINIF